MDMLGTFTNYFTSAVSITVSLGWRFGSQLFVRPCAFPIRVALSIIFKEGESITWFDDISQYSFHTTNNFLTNITGFKVSFNTWIHKQRRKRMRQLRSGVQLKISKTLRWVNGQNTTKKVDPVCVGGEHDIVAVDAAMKYETLAKMRLNRARSSLEAAVKELKEAERQVADATKYAKSVKSYCKKCQNNQPVASDYVFVDSASTETKKRVEVEKVESTHTPKEGDPETEL
ncbi:hypothetical protein ACHAXM_008169 [Skeletonema potamos]|jgi:hypothetical protein